MLPGSYLYIVNLWLISNENKINVNDINPRFNCFQSYSALLSEHAFDLNYTCIHVHGIFMYICLKYLIETKILHSCYILYEF